MENTEISLDLQSATSDGMSAEVPEEEQPATAPQEQTTEGIDEAEGGTSVDDGAEPTPFLTVQHNHESVNLSEAEATDWIQVGMASKTMLESVRRAAALKGMDAKAFVESFEKAQDDAYRAELIAKYGEDDMDTVNSLMELYQSKKEGTVKAAQEAETEREREAQQSLEGRIADEFIELQKEFPDVEKFEDLPKSVKAEAGNGNNLLFSYLKYLHQEQKKVEAANKAAEDAKKASGGSMRSEEAEHSGVVSALMQGLYG